MTAADDGVWVCLFSGGKDSSWALYRALEQGLPVERLLTVHTTGDSYMYHVPETHLTSLAAESIGIDHVEVTAGDLGGHAGSDAGKQGDREVEPLEQALRALQADLDIAGVIAGAIASDYQTSRIKALADRLGIELFAPLWRADPVELGEAMLDAGFDIRILQVAAAGLDESWLGRRLDAAALAELLELHERYGVHPLGEGGEFETVVVDGPHMDRRIELTCERSWAGDRGRLTVTDAGLAQPASDTSSRE
jgi:diphthine-ammonia ligase